jgi:hypothetical protein
MDSKKSEKQKAYYEAHKDKIKFQISVAQKKQQVRKLLQKLNEGHTFERFPYSRIEKYGLKKDENGVWIKSE